MLLKSFFRKKVKDFILIVKRLEVLERELGHVLVLPHWVVLAMTIESELSFFKYRILSRAWGCTFGTPVSGRQRQGWGSLRPYKAKVRRLYLKKEKVQTKGAEGVAHML
jgi:hypothetical protein